MYSKVKPLLSDAPLRMEALLVRSLMEELRAEICRRDEALAGARNVSDAAAASGELDGALSRLLAIAENYPDLKSNTNFLQLQDELAGTENRIAVARRDYNQSVQTFNAKIKSFPTNILAGMFGFTDRDYFKADEGAKTVPQVKF